MNCIDPDWSRASDAGLVHKLDLPARAYPAGSRHYGAQRVAATYCGLREVPDEINGEWQHGWIPPDQNLHPERVVGGDGRSYERRTTRRFYVAREDQVDFLKGHGYRFVWAVGLPILYVATPTVSRIPGSLLVMPAHSLPEAEELWSHEAYAEYVSSVASRFTCIYVCLHQSCIDKGYSAAFERRGIAVVGGADFRDENSLNRMAALFSQFEFMSSNTLGSHIPYASYWGCKVSVAGPRMTWSREDLEELTFYKNAPDVIDLTLAQYAQFHDQHPQFLCDPWAAVEQRQWGARQLGEHCRRSPEELKRLFGWSFAGRIRSYPRRLLRRTRGVRSVAHAVRRYAGRMWD
jgi:hypothetical protein